MQWSDKFKRCVQLIAQISDINVWQNENISSQETLCTRVLYTDTNKPPLIIDSEPRATSPPNATHVELLRQIGLFSCNFSLVKSGREPDLSAATDQFKINCDSQNSGSCRWLGMSKTDHLHDIMIYQDRHVPNIILIFSPRHYVLAFA